MTHQPLLIPDWSTPRHAVREAEWAEDLARLRASCRTPNSAPDGCKFIYVGRQGGTARFPVAAAELDLEAPLDQVPATWL